MPINPNNLSQVSREDLIEELQKIQNDRANNRRVEASLKRRRDLVEGRALLSKDQLAEGLSSVIPRYLAPKNIGKIDSVMWDFFFPLSVDFGTDPTYDSNTRRTVTAQITQESYFLLVGISRTYNNVNKAGNGAPLEITVRDNQSTRQFNDKPIPMQMIGTKGLPLKFDTPLLMQPNASISLEVKSWIPDGESMATVGSGAHEFVLYGMRVRNPNDPEVIANLWI